ncbi:MAG TPA: ABC transporter substrate-binding protein [Stellaceae bacterium]|nr:ABC transporter substrate-binding protein [Stellaceae bacterium]
MRRRELILVVGSMMTAARPLRGQQKAVPVIGFLGSPTPGSATPLVAAFLHGLEEMGYIEGQNVAIEYRWAEGRFEQLPALAADLVGRKVDVIAADAVPSSRAAKDATPTIPVVFISGSDPVERGLVASFARPGGNLTGIAMMVTELAPKRFELLSEMVPQASVIALLVNPNNVQTDGVIKGVREAARAKAVQLQILIASTEGEIDAAFGALMQLQADALVVGPDVFLHSRREQLVALAARHTVPAIYEWRESVAAGGLASYGPSLASVFRQLGIYAGKVLTGTKPGDLPVEQPTKFELVINLETAKALGLTVPQSLLARADEVIE